MAENFLSPQSVRRIKNRLPNSDNYCADLYQRVKADLYTTCSLQLQCKKKGGKKKEKDVTLTCAHVATVALCSKFAEAPVFFLLTGGVFSWMVLAGADPRRLSLLIPLAVMTS